MDRRELLAAAAAPLTLAFVPPGFAGRRGGTALALVTADLESEIVAVDLSNGAIHSRLRRPPARAASRASASGPPSSHTPTVAGSPWSTEVCASARSSVTSARRATRRSLRDAGSRT